MMIPEDAPVRLLNAQLEELEYGKLYEAYSSKGRKSAADPRVLFKVLVHGYLCGIYSSRKLEEACRYRIDFRWLLEDQKAPDHSTLARFRTGRCRGVVEELFYQFVHKLEGMGETDHKAVFIDGTKLESCAGRYTFVWRKTVEKQLAQVKEKLRSMTGLSDSETHSPFVLWLNIAPLKRTCRNLGNAEYSRTILKFNHHHVLKSRKLSNFNGFE